MELFLIASFAAAVSMTVGTVTWGAVSAAATGGEERRLRERLRSQFGSRANRPRVGDGLLRILHRLGDRLTSPFVD